MASQNLPYALPPSEYDLMAVSIHAYLEDGIPSQALYDLTILAENAEQFSAGMNAMVELGDIIDDHYSPQEPDHGTYTEELEQWLNDEDDDFDPPEDWFRDGGPFGPDDDDPEDL